MLMQTLLDAIFHKSHTHTEQAGFGTFLGVFMPAFVTMIGVFSYLHLGYLVGSMGLFKIVSLIIFGAMITFITALSIASIASNRDVRGGGTYYLLSRCFGLEIGASIGIALYIAHTLMICLCVLGFSESFAAYMPGIPSKVIAIGVVSLMSFLAFVSTRVVLRAQLVILCLIVLSIGTILFGSYHGEVVSNQPLPNVSFWAAFALFYPALTGIEAGAAMSGDLRSPRRSLILGPITAVAAGFLVYIVMVVALYKHVPKAGLVSDKDIWLHISSYPLITVMGFWMASLSSALGCLLSAPRTLHAMAKDTIFPSWVAGGSEREPRIATAITVLFAIMGIYFGKINHVVPYLTMVLLIVYGMLNLATSAEDAISTPSWRPLFRVHWSLALLGAFLCLSAMFMIDSGETFLAIAFVISMYILVRKRGLGSKLDDLRQSIYFTLARQAIYRLAQMKATPRGWRPNFIVLSESGSAKSPLLTYTNQMAGELGFLTVASVLRSPVDREEKLVRWEETIYENLRKQKIEALVEVTSAGDFATGLKNLIRNYGIGPLAPNTVVLGECVREEYLENYIEIVRSAVSADRNVMIVRGLPNIPKDVTRQIDIWFDDRRKENSDLMLLLAYSLRKNTHWRRANLTLKSIAFNEKAKEEKNHYFEKFFLKARMSISTETFQASSREEVHEMIATRSTKHGMVFLGLRVPAEDESADQYGKYLFNLFRDTAELPFVTFVICKQNIDLHSILT